MRTVTLLGTSNSGTIPGVGTPDFSTGPRSKSTTSTWNSRSQRELTVNQLSGKLGADQDDRDNRRPSGSFVLSHAGAPGPPRPATHPAQHLSSWHCPGPGLRRRDHAPRDAGGKHASPSRPGWPDDNPAPRSEE